MLGLSTALLVVAVLGMAAALAETVPAGTVLEIRLEQPVSSYSTRAGTGLSAVLIAPLARNGQMLLPSGTAVQGSVAQVRRVGLGVIHETAAMTLKFDRVVLANGSAYPLHCRVFEVENARERVDAGGRIQGILSTGTLSNRTSGLMGSLAFGNPIAAVFATAASASVLRFSEAEIMLPAGTELLAKLTEPLSLPGVKESAVSPVASSVAEQESLVRLVRGLPFRTVTEKGVPSDLTNLVFLGSASAIERAFAAAGWVVVDRLTAASTYATVRSIAENQGYKAAPMSTLLLGGKPPEFAYAKTLDTFSKRHHLRIWKTSDVWDGETVWTSSSTHDIGIGFSKSNKTFIHLIDTHIDNERAKVVNDLLFTGCVSAVQLVARPWVPRDAKNGTGEPLITDGRIAVLRFTGCGSPRGDDYAHGAASLPVHGNRALRVARQSILTLKNNILRDNVGVMAYSGIHYLVESRQKHDGPLPERTIDVAGTEYTIDHGPDHENHYLPVSIVSPDSGLASPSHTPWAPPRIEMGVNGSWVGYAGGNGGAFGMIFDSTNPPGETLVVVLGNQLQQGWGIGGSVTIDSNQHFSHELRFSSSFTNLQLGLAVVDQDETTGSLEHAFAFDTSGLRTSEFAYNLLIQARPRTARLRPYLAVGPALQLMHLSDAPIKKAPGFFKLGLSNIGLLSAAYNFGSDPPLEGGGIFQVGLNYGAGVSYRISPRWMLRWDYRETLTSQPDFWTKSKADILNNLEFGDYNMTVIGPVLDGAMRTQRASAGLSYTF